MKQANFDIGFFIKIGHTEITNKTFFLLRSIS